MPKPSAREFRHLDGAADGVRGIRCVEDLPEAPFDLDPGQIGPCRLPEQFVNALPERVRLAKAKLQRDDRFVRIIAERGRTLEPRSIVGGRPVAHRDRDRCIGLRSDRGREYANSRCRHRGGGGGD
jgi:hypothetical protein